MVAQSRIVNTRQCRSDLVRDHFEWVRDYSGLVQLLTNTQTSGPDSLSQPLRCRRPFLHTVPLLSHAAYRQPRLSRMTRASVLVTRLLALLPNGEAVYVPP